MDDRLNDLIDKYLRNEMTAEERLLFEQDALNDSDLRSEIELTYLIKSSLSDRKRKLIRTAHWERKRKAMFASVSTISTIAAVLVVGFFVTKTFWKADPERELVAMSSGDTVENMESVREEAIVSVKKSISEGNEEIAIAKITGLEEQRVIPTLKEISDEQFMMNYTTENIDADALRDYAYELHWLKIQSLASAGKRSEAVELLKSFVRLEGKYKAPADSLLKKLSKK